MQLSQILNQVPEFKSWAQKKKLSQKDMDILTEFKNITDIKPVLNWIAKHQSSHSQGEQILELSGELLLMKKSLTHILQTETNSKNLIEKLKKLRHPLSSTQDENKQNLVKNLSKNWPASIKTKWLRQNDKGCLEICFKSFSLKDLEQKIKSLEQIKKDIKKQLWENE